MDKKGAMLDKLKEAVNALEEEMKKEKSGSKRHKYFEEVADFFKATHPTMINGQPTYDSYVIAAKMFSTKDSTIIQAIYNADWDGMKEVIDLRKDLKDTFEKEMGDYAKDFDI